MLVELEIKDFALIEHVRVPFSWGFNVLTGETGAGKSIVMDALNAVLGGKVGPSIIRPQCDRATIEATFKCSPEISGWLKQEELCEEDSETFIVSREISKSGSKLRINGALVNVGLVQELRQKLITIHAQHESRTLLSAQSQMEMLDALGDADHKKLFAKLKTLYAQRKELENDLAERRMSESERERRLDFARFQLQELEEAQLSEPEEDELVASQRKVLANVADLETLLANAQVFMRGHDLDGQLGALELLQKAIAEIAKAAELDDSLVPFVQALEDSVDRIEDESRSLRKYCQGLDADPETLAHLDERAAQLATVKRKYGPTLSDAIARRDQLQEEIAELENSLTLMTELEEELAKVGTELLLTAESLSAKRNKLAAILDKKIQDELVDLGMTNCRFEISLSTPSRDDEGYSVEDVGPQGLDRAEFLISPNPGQALAPVAKIASGGELSRVMLAVKTIFAGADRVPSVIFDEIDTGLSGRVLQTMRDKLARLARSQQIICITHQPIIASIADNHVFVVKEQGKSSTRTQVELLNDEGRLKALAGMAGGQENQEAALSFARALFDESARVKTSLS
ncbi:MAG: DNA repair protein RecN [Candidatus Obscuribacterales bacterium]|jgi:DNA repair protein RecN (Recombination protein N)|nr:DNA repair protein RecN [Candidatus Obscuribacterales bacterium]